MWLVQSEKQKQITRNITKKLCKTPERSLYFHTTTACLIATHKKTAIVIARNMVKEHILQYYKWVVNETQSQKKLDLKQQFWNTYFAENKDKVHVFKVPGYQAGLIESTLVILFIWTNRFMYFIVSATRRWRDIEILLCLLAAVQKSLI